MMIEATILLTGLIAGFFIGVWKQNFESKKQACLRALKLAYQYIDSEAMTIHGVKGNGKRPSSAEIQDTLSELLIYCRNESKVPRQFIEFFRQQDGDHLLQVKLPELITSIRKELWVLFKPDMPDSFAFRWYDEVNKD